MTNSCEELICLGYAPAPTAEYNDLPERAGYQLASTGAVTAAGRTRPAAAATPASNVENPQFGSIAPRAARTSPATAHDGSGPQTTFECADASV